VGHRACIHSINVFERSLKLRKINQYVPNFRNYIQYCADPSGQAGL
jgi:hypothetical protein